MIFCTYAFRWCDWWSKRVVLWQGSHQLSTLNSPIYKKLRFFPARIHRLALQNHNKNKVTILFEARGKAGTRCLSDACFEAREAIYAQESVGVYPAIGMLVLLVDSLKSVLSTGFWGLILGAATHWDGGREIVCQLKGVSRLFRRQRLLDSFAASALEDLCGDDPTE